MNTKGLLLLDYLKVMASYFYFIPDTPIVSNISYICNPFLKAQRMKAISQNTITNNYTLT